MCVKKILAMIFTALLILPVVLTGCEREVSAQEVADNVISAYPKVNTFRMDMDMTMMMDLDTGSDQMEMEITGNFSSSVDISGQKMMMNMYMSADIPEMGKQNISEEMYLVDRQAYMKLSVLGIERWMKMDFADKLWESQNQLAQQVEFLKEAYQITKLDDETIDGTKCYVLQIEPDMTTLFDWVLSQQQELFSEFDLSQIDYSNIFKDISLKEWVAKETYLPVKAEIQITMEILPQDFGAGEDETGSVNIDIQAQIKYYDYGKPVIIELPQEALDAEPIFSN
jgi:hypothetical protein